MLQFETVKLILHRAEVKDHRDIAAMTQLDVDPAAGILAARQLFAPNIQRNEYWKALAYFGDEDLNPLSEQKKEYFDRNSTKRARASQSYYSFASVGYLNVNFGGYRDYFTCSARSGVC